jgi:hypothetical protein
MTIGKTAPANRGVKRLGNEVRSRPGTEWFRNRIFIPEWKLVASQCKA